MKALVLLFLLISITYGATRSPQGDWSSVEGLSPLNDKNYFDVMHSNATKLKTLSTATKTPKELKNIKLVGLKSTLRSYAYGKKFYIPQRMDIKDSFADSLNRSVPAYIPPSQREAEVMKFFGDKMIQNWLSSSAVKSSSFGKAASGVEKAMKVETSISSAPVTPGGKSIDHKFAFQYLALQSQAKLEYKGWTQAQLKHDSRSKEVSVELSEKVFKNKDLVVNHTKSVTENRSSVALRWSW